MAMSASDTIGAETQPVATSASVTLEADWPDWDSPKNRALRDFLATRSKKQPQRPHSASDFEDDDHDKTIFPTLEELVARRKFGDPELKPEKVPTPPHRDPTKVSGPPLKRLTIKMQELRRSSRLAKNQELRRSRRLAKKREVRTQAVGRQGAQC